MGHEYSQKHGFRQPWDPGENKNYSNNLRYTVGTKVIISWSIDFENPALQLWQDNLPGDAQGGPMRVIEDSLNVSTYDWDVSYEGIDPLRNNVYYLQLQNGDYTAVSRYVNISDRTDDDSAEPDPTSFTVMSSTTEPPSSSTQSRTVPETTVTYLIEEGGASLSAGGIAGVVLGALGVTMMLAGGMWWWWRRKAGVKSHGPAVHTQNLFFSNSKEVQESGGEQIHEVAAIEEPPRIYEVDGTSVLR